MDSQRHFNNLSKVTGLRNGGTETQPQAPLNSKATFLILCPPPGCMEELGCLQCLTLTFTPSTLSHAGVQSIGPSQLSAPHPHSPTPTATALLLGLGPLRFLKTNFSFILKNKSKARKETHSSGLGLSPFLRAASGSKGDWLVRCPGRDQTIEPLR